MDALPFEDITTRELRHERLRLRSAGDDDLVEQQRRKGPSLDPDLPRPVILRAAHDALHRGPETQPPAQGEMLDVVLEIALHRRRGGVTGSVLGEREVRKASLVPCQPVIAILQDGVKGGLTLSLEILMIVATSGQSCPFYPRCQRSSRAGAVRTRQNGRLVLCCVMPQTADVRVAVEARHVKALLDEILDRSQARGA